MRSVEPSNKPSGTLREREGDRLAQAEQRRVEETQRREERDREEATRRLEEDQRGIEEAQRRKERDGEETARRLEEEQRRLEEAQRRAAEEQRRAAAEEQAARRTRIEIERDIALLTLLGHPSEDNRNRINQIISLLSDYRDSL